MSFLDLLYPKHCPVCLDALPPGDTLICPPCRKKIRHVSGPVCYGCGTPIADETQEYCRNCRKKRPLFEENIAWAEYASEDLRRMIAQVKYHADPQLLDFPCGDFAVRAAARVSAWHAEALIPVPVHESRLKTRGYNQAEEIADRLGKVWRLPVDTGCLSRTGKTEAQKTLGAAERRQNLRGAFRASEAAARYSRVVLIDDIYTTGSTMNACAEALLDAGVDHVYAAVLLIGREN